MKQRFRKIILEPKRFFGDLWHIISWPKVIILLILVAFFVNLGIFIYNKKNPIDTSAFTVDSKVKSPYTEGSHENVSSSTLFGTTSLTGDGNAMSAPLSASEVFAKKTSKGENNLPPVARIKMLTSNANEGIVEGDTVFLSASDSYDPDGSIKTYRWDYDQSNGLGIDAEGVNATVQYNRAGVYTVTLIAIDDVGVESTTTMSINVAPQKAEQTNNVIQGLTTNSIDIDSLNFMSRVSVQQALEQSFADFTSESYTMLAQSIYNSAKKDLPTLPSLADIEMSVGSDVSNTAPVIDSVLPKKGSEVFNQKPVIAVGFYGNNKIDTQGIQLTVDGKNVTSETLITEFGVQYTPEDKLDYGQHSVMIVVPDEKGLKSVESYNFTIVDKAAENADLVEKYEDKQGPQMLMHSPDANAKNVKTSAEIIVKYDEPIVQDTVEIAVVDLSTNITKFFTKSNITFDSTNTSIRISSNEPIFDYDRSYQVVARQEDELGNKSSFEWYVMAEAYGEPEFTITYPEDKSATNEEKVVVKGYSDPTYQITVKDTVAVVDMNGNWEAEIALEKGEQEVVVTAKDLRGRTSAQTFTITYDPTANEGNPIIAPADSPVIKDASIRDGQTIAKVRPQISFVFGDSDGINRESIRLYVDKEDVTDFSYIAEDSITYKPLKDLKQGEHTVRIVIEDKLGNSTDYSMKFKVDAYADAPMELTAALTNNNENVLLVWDAVTNVTNAEYRVYRSIQPNVAQTAGTEIARGLKDTKFTDTAVVDGTTYYYVVVAVTNQGNETLSNPSNEVKIRVDFTPPALTITSPIKDFETQQDWVEIKGSTEKDAKVEVFVNFVKIGEPVIADNGSWSIEADLIPGDNIITTVSTDTDGNETIDIRTVTYTPPDLEAPRPEKRSDISPRGTDVKVDSNIVITYNEEINPETIKLTVKRQDNSDNVVPVTITDIALQVSDDGRTVTYNPRKDFDYEAVYVVDMYVEDLAGNESVNDDWEFETEVKDAPHLEVIAPMQNYYTEKTDVFVTGKSEPNVDIKIRITTSGGETNNPNSIDQPVEYNLKTQADGTFSQLVKLYPYKENIITVIATDHLGHSSMSVVTGLVSPPDTERPLLIVNSPTSGSTVATPTVMVSGQTEPEVRITMNVNGEVQQDFDMNGNINFNKQVRLIGGQNLIKVIATDKSGNQEMVVITIFYDNIPPLLDIVNPIDGLTTNQDRIEVRGITERNGETSVRVMVNGGSANTFDVSVLADGTFSRYVDLRLGNNTITFIAKDRMNNETTIVRTVYFDPVHGVFDQDYEVDGAGTENSGSNGGSTGGKTNEGTPSNGGSTGSNPTGNTGSTNGQGQSSNPSGVDGQSTNGNIDHSTGEMNYSGGDNKGPDKIDINDNLKHGTETTDNKQGFSGKTEAEAGVTVHQNGKEILKGKTDVSDGSFGVDVTLQEGKNIFITNAQDASGNRTQSLEVVTLDTTGPATNVMLPKQNTLTNENEITVYGLTEKNSKVEVTLDGTKKTVTSDEWGYFTVQMRTGADGNKNITVVAYDKLGNTTTKTVAITVDKTKPALTLMSIDGINFPDNVVSDTRMGGVMTVGSTSTMIRGRAEVGSTVEVISNNRTQGTVKVDESGYFYVSVGFGSDQTSEVRVNAKDPAGNVTSKYFRVGADKEPPQLTIYSPLAIVNDAGINVAVSGTGVRVTGVVDDDGNDVKITFGLNSNRNVGTTTTNGYFSQVLQGIGEGTNVIHITAVDPAGNKTYQTVSFAHRPDGIGPLGQVPYTVNNVPESTKYFTFSGNKALAQAQAASGNSNNFGKYGSDPSMPPIGVVSGLVGKEVGWDRVMGSVGLLNGVLANSKSLIGFNGTMVPGGSTAPGLALDIVGDSIGQAMDAIGQYVGGFIFGN